MMNAWISGIEPGLENLNFSQQPIPQLIPGHVQIKIDCAALNYSDLLMINDTYQVKPPRPFIPGQEISGTITATNTASRFQVGQRIASKVFWGGFAQYALVREDMAIQLPDNISFAVGAALPVVYITALVALDGLISPEKTVLIHAAAGGVGLAAVEIARASGARIIATAGSKDKLAIAHQHGADITINYRDDDWSKQVKAATDGRGADVIVDPVGGDVAIESLRCIARYGTHLVIGFASGKIAQLPSNRLLLKSASSKGILWSHDDDELLVERMNEELLELLRTGKINPVINSEFKLEELPLALAALENRSSIGKLILQV